MRLNTLLPSEPYEVKQMKFYYMSDLHLEFELMNRDEYLFTNIKDSKESTLILAGDIYPLSLNSRVLFDFLFRAGSAFHTVYYVLGNHEFYGGEIKPLRDEITKRLSLIPNLYVLDNSSKLMQLGDKSVLVMGGTLWTNINNESSMSMIDVKSRINDFRMIRFKDNKLFTPEKSVKEFKITKDYIFNTAKGADKIVVVTHHLPSFKSVPARFRGSKDNFAFFSDLDKEIEKSKIDFWVHGHTHNSFDYMIGKTRILCNPKGYKKENLDFSILKHFEIF